MILGLDHIALSVSDTTASCKELEQKGFTCQFLESGVPNNPAKKGMLANYQEGHDLGVFRPDKGVSIEITNHGFALDETLSPYEYNGEQIILRTSDPEIEKQFWIYAMGFKEEENGLLKFSSMIPGWSCELKIIEDNTVKPALLDSKGYPCLAFLTNKLHQDMDKIIEAGAHDIIETFTAHINSRNLLVILFRTPGGALCELIQIERKRKA